MQDMLGERLDYLGLGTEAREKLEHLNPVLEAHLGEAIDKFHGRIAHIPSAVRFLFGKEQLDSGSGRQAEQFRAVLLGQLDDQAADGSMRLGQRHARLKLDPRWHVGGYGVMLEAIIRGVVQDVLGEALKPRKNRLGISVQRDAASILADADVMAEGLAGVVKAVLLDIDLVVSAHIKRVTDDARASEDLVRSRMRKAAQTAGNTLRLVADGRLDERVPDMAEPEFEAVRESANAVADRLSKVLGQLRNTSHSLRNATGEIRDSAGDLAERTLGQAVAIEQANDMIRQLATTLAENAKRLSAAGKITKGLVQGTSASGIAMREAGDALAAIIASNDQLSGLVKLFDDMAFQTNILAMKASVEAANAGKAGTGFGDVAVEMRALAQRAAEASMSGRSVIEAGNGKVNDGMALVARAIESLGTINGSAAESAQTVDAVAKAGRNQVDALEQVIIVLRDMNAAIEHNAVLGEQTSAALAETSTQIEALDLVMRLFERQEGDELAIQPAIAS